jgi:hypothetical protein
VAIIVTAGPQYVPLLKRVYATTLQSFRNSFGTTATYGVITQYSNIQQSNLGSGTADWFDTTTPPTNVTDAKLQSEIATYLTNHTFDASTVYEVVLPSTSYVSSGGGTSCGGTNVQFCSYAGAFVLVRESVLARATKVGGGLSPAREGRSGRRSVQRRSGPGYGGRYSHTSKCDQNPWGPVCTPQAT